MTRVRVIAAAIALGLLALGIAASRSGPESAPPGGGSNTAKRDEGGPPLVADVVVVRVQPIAETMRTVGTLLANESVTLVSELSRRLEAIAFTEGSQVRKGDVLFRLDSSDLRAQLAELDARRELAARTVERQQELLQYEKRALSQQAYDQAATDLKAIEAEIAALRVTLAKAEIRAPFDGRAGLRRVSEGAWITPDIPLTTIQDTSRIKVDFTLPERYAGALEVGQTFTFRVAGRGESFKGTIIAVEAAIDATTRSVRARGIADNPEGALVPGAFATVEIPLGRASEGILVPAQAIVPSATGHAVWVTRDGRATLREVEIGLRTREAVEVVRGLEAGEAVLTSNLLRVREGARIQPASAGP